MRARVVARALRLVAHEVRWQGCSAQMVLAIAWTFVWPSIAHLGNLYAQRIPQPANNTGAVSDLVFDLFPNGRAGVRAMDALAQLTMGLTYVRLFLLCPIAEWLPTLRRFMLLGGVVMTLRAGVVVATRFPNPDPTCVSHAERMDAAQVFVHAVLKKDLQTCHDVMYSGHAALTMSGALAPSTSRGAAAPCVRWARRALALVHVLVVLVFGLVIMPLNRFHYTADSLVAFAVVTLLWGNYYQLQLAARDAPWWMPRLVRWYENPATASSRRARQREALGGDANETVVEALLRPTSWSRHVELGESSTQ